MEGGGAFQDRGPTAFLGPPAERPRAAAAICLAWARAAAGVETAEALERLDEARLGRAGVRLYQIWRAGAGGCAPADALAHVPAIAKALGHAFYVTESPLYLAPFDERGELDVVEAHLERLRVGDALLVTTPREAALVLRRDAYVVYAPDGALRPGRAALYRAAELGWAAAALRLALLRGGPLIQADGTHGRADALFLQRRLFGRAPEGGGEAQPT